MAFQHFHKHSAKYMTFFFIATLFSLFAFNVQSALTTAAARLFGGSTGAYISFTTSSGKETGLDEAAWKAATIEVPGAAILFQGLTNSTAFSGFDPFRNKSDIALAHCILLAEAEEMGIAAPPERAEQILQQYKDLYQHVMHRTEVVTQAQFDTELQSRYRLTEESFTRRITEMVKVDAYVRTMKGIPIQNPEAIYEIFKQENAKVAFDYVEFPYEKYQAELMQSPPPDADLEAYFKGLAKEVIDEKYTRSERFTIDLALMDADTWDPSTLAPGLLPDSPDATDDELLAAAKRDPFRITGTKNVPSAVTDLTAEMRAKFKKQRQLKAVLDKARSEFDAAEEALPVIDASKTDEEKKALEADRAAKEKEAFAQIAAKYGFTLKSVADQEEKQLAELDPPKDTMLRFLAGGLAEPGKSGLHVHAVEAAGERKHAYLVRLSDVRKPREAKPFAEVKEDVLKQWVEEHAKERALAKAHEFTGALLAEAEKNLPPDVLAAFKEARSTRLILADTDPALNDEAKKDRRESIEAQYLHDVASAIGPSFGARYAEVAKSLGLEVKTTSMQRANVATTWYFNDRFAAAEKFLFHETWHGDGTDVYAVGMVSDVLVDEPGKTAYVIRAAKRDAPTVDEMTPKDRTTYEEKAKQQQDLALRFYANPFSIAELIARHHPKLRVLGQQSANPYGS